MNPRSNQNKTHPSERDVPKAAQASPVDPDPSSKHRKSNPVSSQPFMSLAKDFDVDCKTISYGAQHFQIDECNYRVEVSYGPDKQWNQAGHYQLDRPWASNPPSQSVQNQGIDYLKRRVTEAPFSHWMSEAPTEAPYHGISSVKKNLASHSSQNTEKPPTKDKHTGRKAGTW